MGNVLRVSHLCLKVADIKRAEDFYVGVLGLTVVNRDTMAGQPLVVLGEGLGLTTQGDKGWPRYVDHIGLRVASIDAVVKALEQAGVPIISGPKQSPYGTSVYFLDPDGNRIECHDSDRK